MSALLRRVLGGTSSQAAPVDSTDDVIPAFALDDTSTNRGIAMSWTLKFDDVLDADKLHGSLARLLATGNWRKVGGRLRLNVSRLGLSCDVRRGRANAGTTTTG